MKFKTIIRSTATATIFAALIGSSANAANTLTTGAKVTKIDATTYSQNIKVQTTPRPNITGLSCSSNFWVILRGASPAYKSLLASILTAQAGGNTVQIGADDTNLTEGFCELSRFIVE